ncbi:hypothetical protein Cgig2_023613 [Carnegiea gigantea]|uniref:Protein FAR1-RELATED SEQUENCE n=1 Tax=Carnegiea gigantea TaxID=171969 RepID=A0A9Q1KDT7_9CARY|nr:hypothetical protein Cgig2_023613 [Carnegiea gigantea]
MLRKEGLNGEGLRLEKDAMHVRFVRALESQRYQESKAENASLISLPELKTPLDIEKHGRVMYTHTNFYIFRDQLCDALFNCEILCISTGEGDSTYKIEDKRHQRYRYVVYNKQTQDVTCTCYLFQSEGIPYAHILLVLKSLKEIPACFKVDRWTKLAAKKPIFELDTIASTSYAQVGQQNRMISDAWSRYNALCSAIGATPSLASNMPTPFYPLFLQNLAIEVLDELVEPGLHKMDMRNKDEVIIRMQPAVANKQFGQEDIICSLTVDGATKGSSLGNGTCQDVWTEYHDMGTPGIKAVADYKVYTANPSVFPRHGQRNGALSSFLTPPPRQLQLPFQFPKTQIRKEPPLAAKSPPITHQHVDRLQPSQKTPTVHRRRLSRGGT